MEKMRMGNLALLQEDLESILRHPNQLITDAVDLAEYRQRWRNGYEDLLLQRGISELSVWLDYARWEEAHQEFDRARSVMERAIDFHAYNKNLWLYYAELEMRNGFIDRARKVWDDAVSFLPKLNVLWLKYVEMEEEKLGNVDGARQVFERWMAWQPYHQAWRAYISFELRYHELDRARAVYDRFATCPGKKTWNFGGHKWVEALLPLQDSCAEREGESCLRKKLWNFGGNLWVEAPLPLQDSCAEREGESSAEISDCNHKGDCETLL